MEWCGKANSQVVQDNPGASLSSLKVLIEQAGEAWDDGTIGYLRGTKAAEVYGSLTWHILLGDCPICKPSGQKDKPEVNV